MKENDLSAIYERIGEFFANSENISCIIAFNSQESEIFKKCGLQCIGNAIVGTESVEIFTKKNQIEKYIPNHFDTNQPFKQSTPWVTPTPYFPPNVRGYELGPGPTAINCKF